MMVEEGLGEVLGDMEQILLTVSIVCFAIANCQGGVVGTSPKNLFHSFFLWSVNFE
jgi:hypothetical protein